MNKGLAYIGEGIGFAGLCIAVAWCEVHGNHHPVFWVMIFLWIMFFGPRDNNKKEVP